MTSREKLERLLSEFASGRGPGGDGPLVLALRTMLRLGPFKDAIRDVLAKDPAELDAMFEWGARQLLQLRSDEAAELVTVSVCIDDGLVPGPDLLPGG